MVCPLQAASNSSAPAVNKTDPAAIIASLGKGICKLLLRPHAV